MTSVDNPRNLFYIRSSTSVDPTLNKIFVDTGEFITLIAHNLSIIGGIVTDTIEAETIGGPITFNSDLNMSTGKKITINGSTVIDSSKNLSVESINVGAGSFVFSDSARNLDVNSIRKNGTLILNDEGDIFVNTISILGGWGFLVDTDINMNINTLSINGSSIIDVNKNINCNSVAINSSSIIDSSKNINCNSIAINGSSLSDVSKNIDINTVSINGSQVVDTSRNFIGNFMYQKTNRPVLSCSNAANTNMYMAAVVNGNGSIFTTSHGLSVTRTGVGLYSVAFTCDFLAGYGASFSDTGNWGFATAEFTINSTILVVVRNSAGVLSDFRFSVWGVGYLA